MDERNNHQAMPKPDAAFINEPIPSAHESVALCTVVTMYDGKNEQEANGEINLPDYYGNADRILFTTATPVLTDVYLENGRAGYNIPARLRLKNIKMKMKQKEIQTISVEVLTMKINEMMIVFLSQSNL